ncbi:MAG TPA: class II fructose-bisphosphate aldolase [Candidatus Paceibacterota bacterium]|nr:class II fructose-bisphosphate aldolase [Candidatus Paceibacterota bacterium]
MKSLREILADADARHVAVGHFNISELGTLKGIFAAAQEFSKTAGAPVPILIGVSEGEREFIGVKQAALLVKSLRDEYDYPIYLNADHTHSPDKVKEAAEAGFDEILFDGSALPFEENIKQTKEAVAIVKAVAAAAGRDIVFEGEIGFIGAGSEILDRKPDLVLSTPEEAARFVAETGVDVLAPAVGNMHGLLAGMAAGTERKRLDIARIGEIKQAIAAAGCRFMTLHGGSGTADGDFVAAVKAGMTIVHVSSELRLAWRRGVEQGLRDPNEIAPYKLMAPSVEGVRSVVADRLKLFN